MPLSYQDQISMLKDILSEHESDCCGTVAECEQVQRLARSLMQNANIGDETKTYLDDIYSYGQTGAYSPEINNHIQDHKEQLGAWIGHMDSYS